MAFEPQVNASIRFRGTNYKMAEHPSAPGFPYGQEGRQGVVYKLNPEDKNEHPVALKVFRPKYRVGGMSKQASMLNTYKHIAGLSVSNRTVVIPETDNELVNEHEDLLYSAIMPWIEGPTWADVMLEKKIITKNESLDLAKSLGGVLTSMEKEQLAHCDLSAPNVMLPGLISSHTSSKVELVDLEQMFSANMETPDAMPLGSPGYAVHKAIRTGFWSAEADRFSGAILLSEMLAWCDADIRDHSYGDSFFDPQELQTKSARYEMMIASLTKTWGNEVAQLFIQAWQSAELTECPKFSEWLAALQSIKTQTLGWNFNQSKKQHQNESIARTQEGQEELLKKAGELERIKDYKGALNLYQTVCERLSPNDALYKELQLVIQQIQQKMNEHQQMNKQPQATSSAPPKAAVPSQPRVQQAANQVHNQSNYRGETNHTEKTKPKKKIFKKFKILSVLVLVLAAVGFVSYQFKEDLPYVGTFFKTTKGSTATVGADAAADSQSSATSSGKESKETISLWSQDLMAQSGEWDTSESNHSIYLNSGSNGDYVSYDLLSYQADKATLTGNIALTDGIAAEIDVLVDSKVIYKTKKLSQDKNVTLDIDVPKGRILTFKVKNKSVSGDSSKTTAISLNDLTFNLYSYDQQKEPKKMESFWNDNLYSSAGEWESDSYYHSVTLSNGENSSYVTYNLEAFGVKKGSVTGGIIPNGGIPFKLEFYVDNKRVAVTKQLKGNGTPIPFNIPVEGKIFTVKLVNNSVSGNSAKNTGVILQEMLLNINEQVKDSEKQEESLWANGTSSEEGAWEVSDYYHDISITGGNNGEYISYDLSDSDIKNRVAKGTLISNSGIPFHLEFKVEGKVVEKTKEFDPSTDVPIPFEFPADGKLLTVTLVNNSVDGNDEKTTDFTLRDFVIKEK